MYITLDLATVFPSHRMLYIKPPPTKTHPELYLRNGDNKACVHPPPGHGDQRRPREEEFLWERGHLNEG